MHAGLSSSLSPTSVVFLAIVKRTVLSKTIRAQDTYISNESCFSIVIQQREHANKGGKQSITQTGLLFLLSLERTESTN